MEKWKFLSNKPDLCQSQSKLHVCRTCCPDVELPDSFNKWARLGLDLQNLKKMHISE